MAPVSLSPMTHVRPATKSSADVGAEDRVDRILEAAQGCPGRCRGDLAPHPAKPSAVVRRRQARTGRRARPCSSTSRSERGPPARERAALSAPCTCSTWARSKTRDGRAVRVDLQRPALPRPRRDRRVDVQPVPAGQRGGPAAVGEVRRGRCWTGRCRRAGRRTPGSARLRRAAGRSGSRRAAERRARRRTGRRCNGAMTASISSSVCTLSVHDQLAARGRAPRCRYGARWPQARSMPTITGGQLGARVNRRMATAYIIGACRRAGDVRGHVHADAWDRCSPDTGSIGSSAAAAWATSTWPAIRGCRVRTRSS